MSVYVHVDGATTATLKPGRDARTFVKDLMEMLMKAQHNVHRTQKFMLAVFIRDNLDTVCGPFDIVGVLSAVLTRTHVEKMFVVENLPERGLNVCGPAWPGPAWAGRPEIFVVVNNYPTRKPRPYGLP
eukprot:m.207191 g.207191  ORF g.207191 m.207191 type:complete len:128 (-) comp10125_c2_seq13:1249-1632(-)